MIETASGTGTRLADRTAVITGGASGIGRASALRFASEGAEVVVWDLDPVGIDAVVTEIRRAGGRAHGVAVDISDASAVAAAAAETAGVAGEVTVLMNNAGVLRLCPAPRHRRGAVGPHHRRQSQGHVLGDPRGVAVDDCCWRWVDR